MNHLTDDDIQKYLDKESGQDRAEIEKHLKSCEGCRQNHLLYKKLYTGLADETGFMLSANFSESVVSRVKKSKEKSSDFFESVLLAIAGLFSLGLIFYFTNLSEALLNIFRKNAQELEPFLKGIGSILGGNLTILIFAIAIIILFGIADKVIFQVKHR